MIIINMNIERCYINNFIVVSRIMGGPYMLGSM